MKSQLHCPDCATGILRVLSDKELLEKFPSCRAAECVRHPEDLKTQYYFTSSMEMREKWGRPKRIGVYCDKCKHFHDMDERSLDQTRKINNNCKPKSIKIKGYGNLYY